MFGFDLVFCEDSYLEHLLELAEKKQLYNDRYWQILLHYKNTFDGVESLIDDPLFFLAGDGKTNPKAELRETLKGFFAEENAGNAHPRCRFIARFSWLKEKLNINESYLPKADCEEYQDAASKIAPKSAVLAFPSALMNMPASMFGHTLLRIDNKFQSSLLSYAVNYSAVTGDTGGILYIFRGLLGHYKGFFSIRPFYEKIKEYNDIEQRDMWEYNLNLSEEELQKMLMHLWELKDIYSYYYFFDENCSYNILFLLEAARPSLNLTDSFRFWVIPIDTVRAVKKSKIVEALNYRPSKATIINHIASIIDEKNYPLTKKIIDGETEAESLINSKIATDEKIKILDLAVEIIQYKYFKKELPKEEYLKLFLSVLNVRSQLGRSEDSSYKIPVPAEPEKGHPSSRLGLGTGVRKNKFFQEIRIRPAYHDLLDPDDGFMQGSQIVFTDLRARYYFESKQFKIESIELIDVVSISPVNDFFKPKAWKVSTGITRKILRDGAEHYVYYANAGYGLALKGKGAELCYFLAESDINAGEKLEDKYSAGIGATAGLLKPVNDFWKVNIAFSAMHYMLGDKHDTYKGELKQSFRINSNNSITFNLSKIKTYNIYSSEAKLNWNLYF